jgi:hypothetical protein
MSGIESIAGALGLGGAGGAKAMVRALPEGAPLRVAALSPQVGRALAQSGHTPLEVTLSNGRLQLDDAQADALCLPGLPRVDMAPQVLTECARVVKPGGWVLCATSGGLTGRGPERPVVAAVFLHAGLTDLDQRMWRGTVVTRGRRR